MAIKLTKHQKGIFEITKTTIPFQDSYSTIHIPSYFVKKYNLKVPCKVDKALQPTLYLNLKSLVDDINVFKPRNEVPNKKVTTDVEGTSKLIRSKDKSKIEICYRVRNKAGEVEKSCKSNNTCFISITQRELFFKHAKEVGCPETDKWGHDHYYLTAGDYNFAYWSDLMDEEYARLAGEKYQEVKRPEPVSKTWTTDDRTLVDCILIAYAYVAKEDEVKLFKALAEAGYCKLNDKETAVYDINGYYIAHLEFLPEDSSAYTLRWVIAYLNSTQLRSAYQIIKGMSKDLPIH